MSHSEEDVAVRNPLRYSDGTPSRLLLQGGRSDSVGVMPPCLPSQPFQFSVKTKIFYPEAVMNSDQGSVTGYSTPECVTGTESGSCFWLDLDPELSLILGADINRSNLVDRLKKDHFVSTSSLLIPIVEEDFPGVDTLLSLAEELHMAMPPIFRAAFYKLNTELIFCILKFLEAPLGPAIVTEIDGTTIKSLGTVFDGIHVIQIEERLPIALLETGLIAACLLQAPVIVSTGREWLCLDFIDGAVYREGMYEVWFANCWGRDGERERLSQNLYKLHYFLNNHGQRTTWKTE